ncbi:hypothetical protein GHT06_019337 [Daphnia sinensis]|uniref:MICOS complex subunit MIC13 n=1 Tax=Daphnia sinensis TaxID=1820382 RepID=A0AAD5L0N1_9CRUS|nr:hypothetical protein GHT06_019337 [Daphnia sinensis]
MKWKKFFMLFDFSRRIPFSSAPSDRLGNVVKVSTDNMASKLWKLFKFSVRVGIPATAVYVTTQEGLWGTQEETFLFYKNVEEILPGKETVISKDQEDKLAAVLEKVRVWSDPNHVPLAVRWNNGVIKAVAFLDSLPEEAKKFLN